MFLRFPFSNDSGVRDPSPAPESCSHPKWRVRRSLSRLRLVTSPSKSSHAKTYHREGHDYVTFVSLIEYQSIYVDRLSKDSRG